MLTFSELLFLFFISKNEYIMNSGWVYTSAVDQELNGGYTGPKNKKKKTHQFLIAVGFFNITVTEWISLELNIYISILFLSFEIDLAFI